MSVSVANSSANISGKTLLTAENPYTVTGAYIFTGANTFSGLNTFSGGVNAPLITGVSGGNFLVMTSTGLGATTWTQYLTTIGEYSWYQAGLDRMKLSSAGKLSVSGDLDVGGNSNLAGDLTVVGDFTYGGTLSLNSPTITGNLTVSGIILPDPFNVQTIGNGANPWNDVFTKNIAWYAEGFGSGDAVFVSTEAPWTGSRYPVWVSASVNGVAGWIPVFLPA